MAYKKKAASKKSEKSEPVVDEARARWRKAKDAWLAERAEEEKVRRSNDVGPRRGMASK